MRRAFGRWVFCGLLLTASASQSLAASPGLAIVKYAKGNLKVAAGDTAAQKDLLQSDLLPQGARVESGKDGKAVLRLLPDQAFMEIRPKSAFTLKRVKTKDKRVRRVTMESGEVVFGLKKRSESVQCENAQTQATAAGGKFSCKTDAKGVAVFLVQDGELSVYNRPKELTVVVRSGQKAISDLNGIKVTDATDSEMEEVGFRQNTIEVDFLNPQTEDYTTLEVEYESNF
jgi:ferric-dicitrate binding protein FerR (iron transport regulator)